MSEPPVMPCSEDRLDELLRRGFATEGELAWLISEARDARALRVDAGRLRDKLAEKAAELSELRDERSRLLGDLVGLIDARDLVMEIRDSLKAADVHECYRGVRAALEHYDDRRERGGE